MKFLAALIASAISGAVFAQEIAVPGCKLLSDGNGTKVWQCAPTPAANSSRNVGSEDRK
jgi:hypothetical protein